MTNEQLFRAIQEIAKQYSNIKNEDKYREKCISVINSIFGEGENKAEAIFDLAMANECLYHSNVFKDVAFRIDYINWEFQCYQDGDLDSLYYISYNFEWDTNIQIVLETLDNIATQI